MSQKLEGKNQAVPGNITSDAGLTAWQAGGLLVF
jgi:hypothetical protein